MPQKSFHKPGHKARRPAAPHGGRGAKPAPDTHKSAKSPEKREKRGGRASSHSGSGGTWLYGIHAVRAALANPKRRLGRAVLTDRAVRLIGEKLLAKVQAEITEPGMIDRLLPPGAVHQGVALEAWPLKARNLEDVVAAAARERRRVVLVLDQLSDPHNVGAILRTAAAFDVAAVVVQDRHAPPQSGALAKAASGALDMIPYVEVVNIARALDQLAELGFWRIALAGDGKESLAQAVPAGDVALVLGAEGAGIRPLVRAHCEAAAIIPIGTAMESLNVSNAAAIALYELRR